MRTLLLVLTCAIAASCASPVSELSGIEGTLPDLLILGEQHDVASHQDRHLQVVKHLSSRGRLAAVALEMAERGNSTAGLPTNADETAVRQALLWDEEGWPWAAYGPTVMAAVRAGVPAVGANLPRPRFRDTMADARLDGLLSPAALEAQRQAIRTGHCGLLPEPQIAPMARIQIARDRSMAEVMESAAVPGKTVVLVTGAAHADPALGVPRHLPRGARVKSLLWAAPANPGSPAKDYCDELRRAMPPTRLPNP